MTDRLEEIERGIVKQGNFEAPPLHLWEPDLSGDIDIRIDREGAWYHEGTRIERASLVRLFASILRREADGHYYLVTPAEKWRLQVELHPLIVVDVEALGEAPGSGLRARLNTGRHADIGGSHPLFLESAVGDVAGIRLWHGLAGLFSRPAWYRLVEGACEIDGVPVVRSGDYEFPLAQPDE